MYVLRFDLPTREVLYAGTNGWVETPEQAEQFAVAQDADDVLNGFFRHSKKYAVIVELETATT